MNKKVYLASPFFTENDLKYVTQAENILEERGMDVFSPRKHEPRDTGEFGTVQWAEDVFRMDVNAIDDSDVVVMLYHGNMSDSGTAWECGYAYATGKPVVVVQIGTLSNLMVHCSARANVTMEELKSYDLNRMDKKVYEGEMT